MSEAGAVQGRIGVRDRTCRGVGVIVALTGCCGSRQLRMPLLAEWLLDPSAPEEMTGGECRFSERMSRFEAYNLAQPVDMRLNRGLKRSMSEPVGLGGVGSLSFARQRQAVRADVLGTPR